MKKILMIVSLVTVIFMISGCSIVNDFNADHRKQRGRTPVNTNNKVD